MVSKQEHKYVVAGFSPRPSKIRKTRRSTMPAKNRVQWTPYEATSFMVFGFNVVGGRADVRPGNGVPRSPKFGYSSFTYGRSYGLCGRTKLRTQSDDRVPLDGQGVV